MVKSSHLMPAASPAGPLASAAPAASSNPSPPQRPRTNLRRRSLLYQSHKFIFILDRKVKRGTAGQFSNAQ